MSPSKRARDTDASYSLLAFAWCPALPLAQAADLTCGSVRVDNAGVLSDLAAFMQLDTLRKLHSFTGLFPLGAYLLFHAYEHAAIVDGRDALIRRLARTTYAPLEVVCVLLPMLIHAVLGLRLARLSVAREVYASPAFARLQLVSGVVSALFLLLHVSTIWIARVVERRPAAAYGAMLEHVGTLPAAIVYIVGVSAVCTHFGQGLSTLLIRHGLLHLSPAASRVLGALVGALLWVVFIDELMAYVTGTALL